MRYQSIITVNAFDEVYRKAVCGKTARTDWGGGGSSLAAAPHSTLLVNVFWFFLKRKDHCRTQCKKSVPFFLQLTLIQLFTNEHMSTRAFEHTSTRVYILLKVGWCKYAFFGMLVNVCNIDFYTNIYPAFIGIGLTRSVGIAL